MLEEEKNMKINQIASVFQFPGRPEGGLFRAFGLILSIVVGGILIMAIISAIYYRSKFKKLQRELELLKHHYSEREHETDI